MISFGMPHLLSMMALLSLQYAGLLVASFSTTHAPTKSSSISRIRNQKRLPTKATSHLCMISFGGGGGDNDSNEEQLPRDVNEAVSNCRQATQTALQSRLSRMDIEFPVGTDFGVEKKTKPKGGRKKLQQEQTEEGAPTQATLHRSNRELARLFVEMFQPVGGDNIVAAFVDDDLADTAKEKWKNDAGASCRVLAMNRRPGGAKAKKKRKKVLTSARGFGAKMAAELDDDSGRSNSKSSGPFKLPDNTEVALFVAPGPKELVVIEKLSENVGMGTLVVLLNARLDKITNFGTDSARKLFEDDFESVFGLAAAPQEQAPGCLLYRAYPGDWVLARKPSVGRPKTILTQSEKPTENECQTAFDGQEISDLEKNVEGFVDNVAGWFR